MPVIHFAPTTRQRIAALALAGGMATWIWPVPVVAAQTVAPAPFPMTPDPSECVVAPRSEKSLQPLFVIPGGEQDTLAETAPSSQADAIVPVGTPVDAVTTAGVIGTLRELFACYNAEDLPRAFSLLTDAYLEGLAARSTFAPEDQAYFFGEPQPAPEDERFSLVAVTDLSMLADGRVGAFVVSSHPIAGLNTDYMILALQDDRWLIDEVFVFV